MRIVRPVYFKVISKRIIKKFVIFKESKLLMILSRSDISERDTFVFNYIKNVLVAIEKAAAATRAAHLCELLLTPINFPVKKRKRFILFLSLESV